MLFLSIFAVLLNLNFANSLIRRDFSVHVGKNITVPCLKSENETVLWSHDGNNISSNINVSNFCPLVGGGMEGCHSNLCITG